MSAGDPSMSDIGIISLSLLKLMSIESRMPSNHLILSCPIYTDSFTLQVNLDTCTVKLPVSEHTDLSKLRAQKLPSLCCGDSEVTAEGSLAAEHPSNPAPLPRAGGGLCQRS